MMDAASFIRDSKNGQTFALYAIPAAEAKTNDEKATLPSKYVEYSDVFSKESADLLPQHRKYDCAIDLKDGLQPPFGPIYSLTQPELAALREYIDENLAKGFIRHSKSPRWCPYIIRQEEGWFVETLRGL